MWLERDLPIGWKLGLTVAGALGLLAVMVWLSIGDLALFGVLQDDVAQTSGFERQIRSALDGIEQMRRAGTELPHQSTEDQVTAASQRALRFAANARDLLQTAGKQLVDPTVRRSIETALVGLEKEVSLLGRATELRLELIVNMQTLAQSGVEVAASAVVLQGEALPAESVTTRQAALATYQLALTRLQSAAWDLLARGDVGQGDAIRSATLDAEAAMAELRGGDAVAPLTADIDRLDAAGKGLARTAATLMDQASQLAELMIGEQANATGALRNGIDAAVRTMTRQAALAHSTAEASLEAARRHIMAAAAAIAAGLVISGTAVTWLISHPLRVLTRSMQTLASGNTDMTVGHTRRRDEIGRMAKALETLRQATRDAFVRGQMIEQLPVSVMTTEPEGTFRILYFNPAARRLLDRVKQHLPVPIDGLLGQSVDMVHDHPEQLHELLSDPTRLPYRGQLMLGEERLELNISALHDHGGAYVGPMLSWRRLTDQHRLVEQFEHSVGAIAQVVGGRADTMRHAAEAVSATAAEAGRRTAAVAAASDQAAGNVHAVAAGTAELTASVAGIGQQATESARIAGQAVAEAASTDRSMAGLSEAAGRIGDVVRLIGDIAGRTNLLALNATIEAARAGEAGKGFAVVASEVKALASQTARATAEIATQIAGMQAATDQAVAALRSIGATIQQMNQISTSIAGAVTQQGAATQEIARAVRQAAAGTAEVSSNITLVTRSVDDTAAQAGEMLAAATELTQQSETLKHEVGDFLEVIRLAA